MSYYLEILSETSYQKFLSQINYDSMPFEEIDELFDEAVIHDTNFAYGNGSDRLLDIINEAEPYSNEFTKEFDYNVYRIRKNKLIKTITSSYDYVDAYVFDDKINYFGKLPQAPIGGYIYDQRLEGTLQSFKLENLSPKKLRRLSWMDYRLIQFLQTGVHPQIYQISHHTVSL